MNTPVTVKKEKDLSDDPRFNFGPPRIQTAEDAREAYLREEIDEETFRAALGKFGINDPTVLFGPRPVSAVRVDDGFERKIPDDLLNPVQPVFDVKEQADAKDAMREQVRKDAENDKTVEETQKREADAAYREKLEQKHSVDPITGDKASVKK